MTSKRFLSLTILITTCALAFGEVSAQTLKRDSGPAEQPPASFSGNQYVDSKGCVYIRAGVDGNTNWVPRVSRSRKVVCGLTPSVPRGTAVASAPVRAPAATSQRPVQIGAGLAATASAAVQSSKSPAAAAIRPARPSLAEALAPRPVRTVASTPAPRPKASAPTVQRVNIPQPSGVAKPVRRVAKPTVVQPRPQQIARVQPRVQTQRVVRQSAGKCNGASGVSSQYIGRNGLPVRCGPQTSPHITYRTPDGRVLDPSSVSPNARIVPRHVYEQQKAAQIRQPVPEGYRPVWEDDRLNPKRAHMTPAGRAQTAMIWTNDVPRRLVMADTGRDVTRAFPGLRFPFTSMAQQQTRAVVSTKSQPAAQRVVRRQVQQTARVSTRSAAPKKPAAAVGKRFVQVGTFGVADNAHRTAQRVQQMGIPVRIGKFMRGGKELRTVLAGPFQTSAHTGGALTALRNAGYRDAFARN